MADVTITPENKNTAITLTGVGKGSSPRFIDLPTTASSPHPATWEDLDSTGWETTKTFLVKETKNNTTITNDSKN